MVKYFLGFVVFYGGQDDGKQKCKDRSELLAECDFMDAGISMTEQRIQVNS